MNTGQLRVQLGPEAPAEARQRLVAAMGPLDPGRRLELELVVSELVTNALVHGDVSHRSELVLRWRSERSLARIEIPGGDQSVVGDPDRWGWGLELLDRIALDWGVAPGPVTWFDIEVRPRSRAELSSADEDELFRQRDGEARDELFRRYESLAISIARRFRGKGVPRADLEQVAALALVKALHRFDPEQGAFPAYASRTISGELKRYLRDRGWSVRVPRSLQEAALEVGRAWQRLSQRLGRAPSVDDVAEETDRDPAEVQEAMEAGSAYRAGSIYGSGSGDDDLELVDRLGVEDDELQLASRWSDVTDAITTLPEREQRILYLRFFEDMTQSQIAEVVGISQMHVSRLLSRSIAHLRELLEEA